MTWLQRHGLETYWPLYGLEPEELEKPECVFKRLAPLTVEIGFGKGDSLLEMAVANPQRNYLGIEVYRPGIGNLLINIHKEKLENLKVVNRDSIEVLGYLPPDGVDCLQVFFPDPWPKRKHHKRRLINSTLLDLASSKLAPGGCLHIATDWLDYAEQIRSLLSAHPAFIETEAPERPETRYEKRGLRLGHEVFDIAYCTRCP